MAKLAGDEVLAKTLK